MNRVSRTVCHVLSWVVVLSAVMTVSGCATSMSGREGDVVEVMTYTVVPGKQKQFEEAWSEMFTFLRGRPGFVSVRSLRDLKDPNLHVDYSIWTSRTQYEAAGAALPERFRSTFMGTVAEWKYFGLTR